MDQAPDSHRLEFNLRRAFRAGLFVKALLAVSEITSAVLLWFVGTERILDAVRMITQHEVTAHPNDRIAAALFKLAEGVSLDSTGFYALYLGSHGLVKLGLVVAMMRSLSWAYPAAIGVTLLFIAYQLYRMTFAPSPVLAALTLFDAVIVVLIWQEWQATRRRGAA